MAEWMWDEHSQTLERSGQYQGILGVELNDLAGLTAQDYVAEFVVPDDRVLVKDAYRSIHEGAEAFDIRYRIARPDGEQRWLREVGRLVENDQGGIVGEVGFMQDLTELVETKAQLHRAERLGVLGASTLKILHDLNNLLTVVGTCAHLLDRSSELLPRKIGSQLTEVCDRCHSIIGGLLKFGSTRGRARRPHDLADLLQRTEAVCRIVLPSQITLAFDTPPSGFTVSIDETQFEMAILNLVVNARDAIEAQGRIDVECSVWADESGREYLSVSVSDDGRGMAASTLSLATNAFYTTKPDGQGTGLGLAKVKEFAETSGGELSIQSEPGRGTTVTISLPRRP